ncbi:MAG TPA: maleylpyruvate isomerase family mycothiol-dependent enzyme [Streptosporangiaceae bacterium]|nr:maleylpyruvate isomerase family mycothiol-dependent enzyme [Streptosporangiaceae bacterium]
METSPGPWIDALRRSRERLRAVAGPLDADQLRRRSYAADWSIAQVLSHIGSQAEIFGLFLDAGLSGQDPPGPEAFGPIWATWNAKSPEDQAADALRADETVTARFESLDDEQRKRFALKLFGMDFDATGLARMRLGEHAVHTWDIAVALDPAATLAPDAVDLLIDTLGQLVARAGKPGGASRRLHVSTSSPVRHFTLETGEMVTLAPSGYSEGLPELALPAEAFIRLVYGRLDPAHTPPVETTRADLDELRQVFPGF